MNKEIVKFWITCPECKAKFGVSPEIVVKYIARLLDQMANNAVSKPEKETGEEGKEGAYQDIR